MLAKIINIITLFFAFSAVLVPSSSIFANAAQSQIDDAAENPLTPLQMENYRIVPLDSESARQFEAFASQTFKKIFASHDLAKEPIRFMLSTENSINAFTIVDTQPRVIVFTVALMKFILNIDEFAAVLGHEWYHNIVHKKLGAGKNSKVEEYIADLGPLEPMHKAGFDIKQAYEFERRLNRSQAQAPLWRQIIDVHGTAVNREKAFKDGLAYYDRKFGGLNNIPSSMPDSIRKIIEQAKHVSFIENELIGLAYSGLSNVDRLGALEQALSKITPEHSARAEDFLAEITKLKLDGEDKEEMKALHRLANRIISLKGPKASKNIQRDSFYARLGAAYKAAKKSRSSKRLPLGRLRKIESAIREFIASNELGEAVKNAEALSLAIDEEKASESFLKSIDWTSFEMPDLDRIQSYMRRIKRGDDAKPQVAKWNRFIEWAKEDQTSSIMKALWQIGFGERRLDHLIGLDLAKKIVGNEIKIISGNETIHSLNINDRGEIVGLIRSKSDLNADIAQRLLGSFAMRLFDEAAAGDKAAEEELNAILSDNTATLHESVYGLDEIAEKPELFMKFNRNHFLAKTKDENRSNAGIKTLIGKIQSLLKEDYKKRKQFVRDLFLTKKYGEALFPLLSAEQQLDGRSESLGYPVFNFLIRDPFKLFSDEEKIKLIDDSSLVDEMIRSINDGDDEDDGEAQKDLARNQLKIDFVRKNLGYSQARSEIDLLALFEMPGMKGSKLLAFETMAYLDKYKPKTLDIETISRFVKFDYLTAYPSIKSELHEYVDKQKKWPSDSGKLIELYSVLVKQGLFNEDKKAQYSILKTILGKIKRLKKADEKIELLESLLEVERIASPKLREEAFALWLQEVSVKYGKDTGLAEYNDEMTKVVERMKGKLQLIDRIEIFSRLASRVEAQRELSMVFKKNLLDLSRKSLEDSHTNGVLGEFIVTLIQKDGDIRNKTVRFLSTPLTSSSLEEYAEEITSDIGSLKKAKSPEAEADTMVISAGNREIDFNIAKSISKLAYENFWSSVFTVRTVILEELLFPAGSDNADLFKARMRYVLDRVFPFGAKYSQEAREIVMEYISIVPEYQKSLLLSAIMISSMKNDANSEEVKIGERLASVFELMGPAEMKLGQAMHSHPKTPDELREGMTRLKSSADVPYRWDLFDLLTEILPERISSNIVRTKQILGAASYYIVVEVEYRVGNAIEPRVIAILRPNALARAANGFKLLIDLVQKMKDNREFTGTLSEMIQQAQEEAHIETDSEIAVKQYETARNLYNNVKISVNGRGFNFKSVELTDWGQGFRVMKKAEGVHFNDLPESSPDQLSYKRNLARAYLALELRNILQGKEFDHDRHGAQVRVSGDNASLFDFGSMSLSQPNEAERKILAEALFLFATEKNKDGEDFSAHFHDALRSVGTDQVEAHKYIALIERAVLALNDFIRYIPQKDFKAIIQAVVENGEVHPDIVMSFLENAEKHRVDLSVFFAGSGVNDKELKTRGSSESRCHEYLAVSFDWN